MINPDCHYGDHDWLRNGRCKRCWQFNPGILHLARQEKKERRRVSRIDPVLLVECTCGGWGPPCAVGCPRHWPTTTEAKERLRIANEARLR